MRNPSNNHIISSVKLSAERRVHVGGLRNCDLMRIREELARQ